MSCEYFFLGGGDGRGKAILPTDELSYQQRTSYVGPTCPRRQLIYVRVCALILLDAEPMNIKNIEIVGGEK